MIKLIAFSMPTCMPCQQMKPTLVEVAETTEVEFINTRENMKLAAKYGIRKVPTLVFLKDDEEVHRTTGLVTKADIDKIIESLS